MSPALDRNDLEEAVQKKGGEKRDEEYSFYLKDWLMVSLILCEFVVSLLGFE